ncbi:MAG: hypothetical protein ACFFDF_21340 [Candidatus Odinarchaeota archaeon]
MTKRVAIPSMCMYCKWYNILGCMYEGELRIDFSPGIKCFEPINNPSYPNPKKIVNKFFKIFYKSFSKLEYAFITETSEYKDGSKFLSILSDNIKLLKKFKIDFLALQKEYCKYPQAFDNEIRLSK